MPVAVTPFAQVLAALLGHQGGAGFGEVDPQDLRYYFDYSQDPAYAASNLLRTRGVQTQAGNPMADYLQGLLPGMLRATDLYNAFRAPAPSGRNNPNITGEERLWQNVSNTMDTFGQGGTSRLNPQNSRILLNDVNNRVNEAMSQPEKATLEQQGWAQRLTDSPEAAWQTVMDVLGGSISPMLRNSGTANATRNRLAQEWRNSGNTNSFLDWLQPMLQR